MLLLVVLTLLLPVSVRAQDSNQVMHSLRAAVMQADATALSSMSAATVDIALFGESKRYSRSQAALLLRSFFEDYPPLEFEISDFTKTASGWFMEGSYSTGDDARLLRVYVRLRRHDTGWLVRELLIEEAADGPR